MGSYVFISYSREDLSFSESIALSLIEQGQAVWFDLLALMPGMDWRSSIRDGIQEAAGIAVVMSPSAAKSPNVADEVRQAIAAGKPLFLAVVEPTPLRLEHAPEIDMASAAHSIVDMRGDFQSALRRLVSACKSGQRIEDSVSLRRLATPPFPRHITELAIASCLFFAGLAYVWAAWFTAAGFPWKLSAGQLNFAALTVLLFWLAGATVAFLRRRLTPEKFATHWLLLFLALGYALLWQRRHVPGLAVNWLLFVGVAGITVVVVYRLFWSPDIFRWKRSEFALIHPALVRQLKDFERRFDKARMAGDPRPYIISLAYSRADESLARMVRKSLRAAANVFEQGMGLRNNNPFPPVNLRALLVTNRLTADEWRAFEDSPDAGRLYLLMAPTRVPAEWVARSSKVQWVDLRRGVYQLGWVLLYLRNVQKARLQYAANCIPVKFDSLKGPNGLAALAQAVNIVAAWTMACGMLALVSPAQTQSISRFLPFAVLLGIWQFSIVHTLYQRSRTLVQFGCELMASLLLCYGIGVYDLIMKAAPVNSSYSAGIPFLFDSKYIVLSAGLVAASTALGFWNLSGCWFPMKGTWRATAGSPTHGAIAKSQLHYLLIAVGVTVYLLANRA